MCEMGTHRTVHEGVCMYMRACLSVLYEGVVVSVTRCEYLCVADCVHISWGSWDSGEAHRLRAWLTCPLLSVRKGQIQGHAAGSVCRKSGAQAPQ